MMPLFILYGGEIVIAIVVTRIVIWIVRSGGLRLPEDPGPGGPEGPRGTAHPRPEALAAASLAPGPAASPSADPERRAA